MKVSPKRLTPSQEASIRDTLEGMNCAVIYVFGSFGGPNARPESDIDIAFLSPHPVDPVACFNTANTLADRLGRTVDLVDLRRASTVMAKEVLRTGSPLLVNDASVHQDFEMRILADYARLNEERQPVLTP